MIPAFSAAVFEWRYYTKPMLPSMLRNELLQMKLRFHLHKLEIWEGSIQLPMLFCGNLRVDKLAELFALVS